MIHNLISISVNWQDRVLIQNRRLQLDISMYSVVMVAFVILLYQGQELKMESHVNSSALLSVSCQK